MRFSQERRQRRTEITNYTPRPFKQIAAAGENNNDDDDDDNNNNNNNQQAHCTNKADEGANPLVRFNVAVRGL
ncbi:hypothetical protein F2P81_021005 [Scophthalmus maximus]|uniref:Uncharacterized protein n=1 Tax=Scophthalmus maximus TaxID=52904 RepID=A0A6A4S277_SCOMX|nr:hypothetical protein F2P81_021005 [Scophthalmus maximus]